MWPQKRYELFTVIYDHVGCPRRNSILQFYFTKYGSFFPPKSHKNEGFTVKPH
jgi:hypothetical protein